MYVGMYNYKIICTPTTKNFCGIGLILLVKTTTKTCFPQVHLFEGKVGDTVYYQQNSIRRCSMSPFFKETL